MLANPATHQSGSAYRTGTATLFLATGVILVALGFEHIGGYIPCPLCLEQRYAYYAAIPLLFAALVLLVGEFPRMAALLFSLVALAFLANAVLGVYHAGAEWKFWPGPKDCTGTAGPPSSVGGLLEGLEHESGARCDEPQLRVLGLSFAGWNVLACLVLALGSARAAISSLPRD
jgi:disulfide bond formation protein DsbB